MKHEPFVTWRTPSPLWAGAAADPHLGRQQAPAILRFATPDFMPVVAAALQATPPGLAELVARREDGGAEAVGWLPWAELPAQPLKLFLPTQHRYYLAVCSAVTLAPGLPPLTSLPVPLRSPDKVPDSEELLWNREAVEKLAKAEAEADQALWAAALLPALQNASMVVRRLAAADPDRPIDLAAPSSWRELAWVGEQGRQGWAPAPADRPAPGEELHLAFAISYAEAGQPRQFHAGIIPAANRERYVAAEVPAPAAADPRLAEFQARVERPLRRLAALGADDEAAAGISAMVWLDLAAFLKEYLPWLAGRIRFRPPWAAWLEQVWAQRLALLAGGLPDPPLDLAGAITPGDIDLLTEVVTEHLAADHARRRQAPPEAPARQPLFVVRFVLGAAPAALAAVWPDTLSRASAPFELAAHGDAGAPQPPPGEVPDAGELIKTLAKLLTPSLPKVKRKKKD
ncbi:MAG: hypothetical protein K0R39_1686 [Symbiobacteriaceae bacterium]|jgi:hypothetical protein|nr:hypothetical protein [Symbiobacteriaceae bacterium]